MNTLDRAALCSSVAGLLAAGAGYYGTTLAATATLNAIGGSGGAMVGACLGSSWGLVSAGAGISAAGPGAVLGAAVGSHLGQALAFFGLCSAPTWAVPLLIAGLVLVLLGLGGLLYGLISDLTRELHAQRPACPSAS